MTHSSCVVAERGQYWVSLPRNQDPPSRRRVAHLRVADLEIDALDRRITQGTRQIRLSPSEHILLYVLAARGGTVVGYRRLADALGIEPEVRSNTLARHLSTLRRKLGDDFDRPRYIQTVPGIGYRFIGMRAK